MHYKQALTYAREMRRNPTKAEAFFWERVKKRSFHGFKFYRQYIIQHADIMSVKAYFIADFYCHHHTLIDELDGPIHEQTIVYDQQREAVLIEMGFKVLRFKNEEVLNNWISVEQSILKVLDELKHLEP